MIFPAGKLKMSVEKKRSRYSVEHKPNIRKGYPLTGQI